MDLSIKIITSPKSVPAKGFIPNLTRSNTCTVAIKDHTVICNEHPIIRNTIPVISTNHPDACRVHLNVCSYHHLAFYILLYTCSYHPFACIDLPVSGTDRPIDCTISPAAIIDLPSASSDQRLICNEIPLISIIHFLSKFQLLTLKFQEDEHKTENQTEHVPGSKKFCKS